MPVLLNRTASFSAIQATADAFAVATINTGISNSSNVGWLIKMVEFYLDPTGLAALGADAELEMALTQDTVVPAAVPSFADSDTICGVALAYNLTTSGAVVIDTYRKWMAPTDLLIVAPTLYACVDSTATGAAQTMYGKIHYELVELKEMDFLRLLTVAR